MTNTDTLFDALLIELARATRAICEFSEDDSFDAMDELRFSENDLQIAMYAIPTDAHMNPIYLIALNVSQLIEDAIH